MDNLTAEISRFAANLRFADLPGAVVHGARQRLIDTIGCAFGGRDSEAVRIARLTGGAPRPGGRPGRCLTFAERMSVESAAFVNSTMSRYLDFNDTGPGSHPSDSIGGLLAVAESAGADGRRLLGAMVVAYETLVRLAFGTDFRKRGWDQGFVTAVGSAAGTAHLLGLDAERTAHAVAIAACANVPLRASRAGQLSLWKACATPFAARNGAMAAVFAAEGMSGPEKPFEGRFGLWEQLTGPFALQPFPDAGGEFLFNRWSRLKFWPVEYNAQICVWAARELRQRMTGAEIASIEVSTYRQAWHEIGSEPAKWDPQTRETADHSLPYIFARTLTDGAITVASFDKAKYADPAIRPLMAKITVRADDAFSQQFPASVPIRVTAESTSGRKETIEMSNPLGHDKNPMSDADIEAKFHGLADPLLGPERATAALGQLWQIDTALSLTPSLDGLIVV